VSAQLNVLACHPVPHFPAVFFCGDWPGCRREIAPGGCVTDDTTRVMGLPPHRQTLISRYDPPRCFVNEQPAGAHSCWHHTHRFEPRNGGTLLFDEVNYALTIPLPGLARDTLQTHYLRPALAQIFDRGRQVLQDLSGAAPATGTTAFHPLAISEENTA
jgi:ligand-binding SRPBCC domain-containing protein